VTKEELKEYIAPAMLEAILPAIPEDGKNDRVPRQPYLDAKTSKSTQ